MTKILVIEDETDIRDEVMDWLAFEGYEVSGASDGREGIAAALTELPDLIVSDINMPEMSGYRVLAELRTHPRTALIPLIFLTARTKRTDVRYAMEMGAEDYITKPFSNEELLSAVRTQLAKANVMLKHADQQVNQFRSNLTRTLPQEIRTPMVALLALGEMLALDAEKLTPAKIKEMSEAIVQNGQWLYHMIENRQLLNQLELHALDPEVTTASNKAFTEHPDEVVAKAAGRVVRNYDRITDLRFDLKGYCSARISEADLEIIVTELVDNACKFSQQQTPIKVFTRMEEGTYTLHIVDQGRIINADKISQASYDNANDNQTNSGLGLMIVKRLMDSYGGTLKFTNRKHKETIVSVTLSQVAQEIAS